MTQSTDISRWDGLMRSALAGDGAAYGALLGSIAAVLRVRMRAALYRAGHGNEAVEDIVQETLLALHLKRQSYDPAQALAPWVHAIARYKMIDALRRKGVRGHVPLDEFTDTIAAPQSHESDHADDLGDAERLILRLGAKAQRIVRGVSIEGRSTSEMADELGMNEGAVRVMLHRALKQLAQLYRSGTP